MLRIAVAEDEIQCQQILLDHIRRFAGESGISCSTDVYFSGSELLEHYKGQYDVLFLDGRPDGLETAEEIRRLDQGVIIVFVSNLAQYAMAHFYTWSATMYRALCESASETARTHIPPRIF